MKRVVAVVTMVVRKAWKIVYELLNEKHRMREKVRNERERKAE
jgi:hypothetical protein